MLFQNVRRNLYFQKHSLKTIVLKKNSAFFIGITMDSVR